jgi:hypothetical protein
LLLGCPLSFDFNFFVFLAALDRGWSCRLLFGLLSGWLLPHNSPSLLLSLEPKEVAIGELRQAKTAVSYGAG